MRCSWFHTKISSVVWPATLALRTLKCSSWTAHNMTAINLEHLIRIKTKDRKNKTNIDL